MNGDDERFQPSWKLKQQRSLQPQQALDLRAGAVAQPQQERRREIWPLQALAHAAPAQTPGASGDTVELRVIQLDGGTLVLKKANVMIEGELEDV